MKYSSGKILVTMLVVVSGLIPAFGQTVYIPSGTGGIGSSSNGNVGIGTPAPALKLEIQGSLSGYPATSGTAQSNGSLRIGNVQTNGVLDIGINSGSGAWLQYTHQGDLSQVFPLLLNPNGGNVGIGTTTPTARLEVAGGNVLISGTNSPYVMLKSNAIGAPYGFLQYDQAEGNFMRIYDGSEYSMVWRAGKVGIGTAAPALELEVQGGASGYPATSGTAQSNGSLRLGNAQTNGVLDMGIGGGSSVGAWLQYTNRADLSLGYPLLLNPNGGNVGIGTLNPTYKLSVNGTIRAKEVIVDTGWSDYVFEKDYRLAPLAEVEQHIAANGHLPGIPSAQEVSEHGVSMGDMQSKLLAKVEELTLHAIAQEKRLDEQARRLARLEAENAQLLTR